MARTMTSAKNPDAPVAGGKGGDIPITRPANPDAPVLGGTGGAGTTPVYGPGNPAPPTPYQPTAGEFADLRAFLTRVGLMSLYDTAVEWMVSGIADSQDRLEQALRATPEFQQRFGGLVAREQRGLPPISIDAYLAYEDQATQTLRRYGYPPGFYDDPSDFVDAIGNDVSLTEFEQRAASYAELATRGRDQVRQQFTRFVHPDAGPVVDSMTDGEIAAYLMDYQKSLPAIRQQLAAASVSAAAVDSGFGGLSFDEASRLTGTGMEESQARQAFAALAAQGDVTGALAGEDEGLSRETQLGVVAGDAAANTALEQARRRRQGAFQGGGSFATGREGVGGLGRA